MTKPNRFLMPGYLWNTVKIKLSANWKKWTRGSSPFLYFKDTIKDTWTGDYELHYHDSYHSLTYFDYEEAVLFHENNDSVTVDLILALTYYNSFPTSSSELDLLSMASNIVGAGENDANQLSFIFHRPNRRFDIVGDHLSAIVQGKAASLFLRCYRLTSETRWLDLAKKSLNHFNKEVDEGGLKRTLPLDMVWMEEYASPSNSMVLNGFLFWLIGLGEFCAITKNESYMKHFEIHLRTVINWISGYRLDKGLLYSMYRWNHCNIHYLAIMKYQFDHLYILTNIELFKEYAEHCNNNTNWNVFHKLIGKS